MIYKKRVCYRGHYVLTDVNPRGQRILTIANERGAVTKNVTYASFVSEREAIEIGRGWINDLFNKGQQ